MEDSDSTWETDLRNPDFAAFAELCSAWGRRVETFENLETILRTSGLHNVDYFHIERFDTGILMYDILRTELY